VPGAENEEAAPDGEGANAATGQHVTEPGR